MMLGVTLQALRRAKGLSIRQAAEQSGLSASTLSRLERGMGTPDTVTLVMLEDFYGVSLGSGVGTEELTDEQAEAYLVGLGYNLDELRAEINALIDALRQEAKVLLAAKGHSGASSPGKAGGDG